MKFTRTIAGIILAAFLGSASAAVDPSVVGLYLGTVSGELKDNNGGSLKRKAQIALLISPDGSFLFDSDILSLSGVMNASAISGAGSYATEGITSNFTMSFKKGKVSGTNLTVITPAGDTNAVFQLSKFKLQKGVM